MAEEFLKHNAAETCPPSPTRWAGSTWLTNRTVEFKRRVPLAIGLIRSGDTTQYANIVLENT